MGRPKNGSKPVEVIDTIPTWLECCHKVGTAGRTGPTKNHTLTALETFIYVHQPIDPDRLIPWRRRLAAVIKEAIDGAAPNIELKD